MAPFNVDQDVPNLCSSAPPSAHMLRPNSRDERDAATTCYRKPQPVCGLEQRAGSEPQISLASPGSREGSEAWKGLLGLRRAVRDGATLGEQCAESFSLPALPCSPNCSDGFHVLDADGPDTLFTLVPCP